MSEVVKLDPAARRAAGGRRKKQSKTALVLGGGGFTGAVYEIGALRAFDLLAVNRTVNEFDVYVGTSAGSFVGSAVANGVTPEEMMRVLNKNLPSPLRDMDLDMMLQPNYRGFLSSAALLPLRLLGVARQLASTVGEASLMDRRPGPRRRTAEGPLPRARGSRTTSPRCSADPDRSDDFRMLERELYLTVHRPRYDRTDRARRRRLERRADLAGGRRLDRAAARLRAGRDQGPGDDRRRHPLDHQRRHRRREGRQVHRRRQPDRPLRQRLQQAGADDHRLARPSRLRHGLRRDRQPGDADDRPRSPPPRRRGVGGPATRASTSS